MDEPDLPGPDDASDLEDSPRGERDPVALAAWRRLAAQRDRRRAVAETDPAEGVDPPDLPPAVGTGAPRPPAPSPARPAHPAHAAAPPEHAVTGPFGAPPEQGGSGTPGRLHDVLLGLAGRIDDDALSSVRELVAVEDDAGAAELLGGCLLAEGVGLTPAERSVLTPWFSAARVDPELTGALPDDPEAIERPRHRFVAAAPAGVHGAHDDGEALARAAARLPEVTTVRQCWRVTPTGSAPGPLPHRIVLVETDSPDECEHVAHHIAHAARDLGAVSVEVLATDAPPSAYHRDALAASVVLHSAAPAVQEDTGVADGAAAAAAAEDTAPVEGAPAVETPEPDEATAPTVSPVAEVPVGPEVVPEPAHAQAPPPPEQEGPDDDAERGRVPRVRDRRAAGSTDGGSLSPDAAPVGESVVEPSTDEPSTDEPSTDEPTVDEPTVDEPVDEAADTADLDLRGPRAVGAHPATPPARVNGHRHGPTTSPHPAPDEVWGRTGGRGGDVPTGPVPWALEPPQPVPDEADSLAQLSDRERALLARLHEELASRERAEATNPFIDRDERGEADERRVHGDDRPRDQDDEER